MNSLSLIIFSMVVFFLAYLTYGKKIERLFAIDPTALTPAYILQDDKDFVPSSKYILLGHHFASIVGVSAIMGPIQASVFGWLPVFLWIVIGAVFFGSILDYGSLMVSVKNQGQSLGDIIHTYLGPTGKFLFNTFAWLSLLLFIASLIDIVSSTFNQSPQVAVASIFFIGISMAFGIILYRKTLNLLTVSVVGIVFLLISIYLSSKFSIRLEKNHWIIFLSIYIFLASVAPIWLILQPRDYLNSYLLWGLILISLIGIFFSVPVLKMPAFNGLRVSSPLGKQSVFPILFMNVASGAVCGYHSLISSSSSSKQLKNEGEARMVAFFSMFMEALLAILALFIASHFSEKDFFSILYTRGPIEIFAKGLGDLLRQMGISLSFSSALLTLALSSFSLTSLDTVTRLAGKILEEIFLQKKSWKERERGLLPFASYFITIFFGCLLALGSYLRLWILFGIANQLLAIIVFFTLSIWMKRSHRKYYYFFVPMLFLHSMTFLSILGEIQKSYAIRDTLVLGLILFILFLWSIITYLIVQFFLFNKTYYK